MRIVPTPQQIYNKLTSDGERDDTCHREEAQRDEMVYYNLEQPQTVCELGPKARQQSRNETHVIQSKRSTCTLYHCLSSYDHTAARVSYQPALASQVREFGLQKFMMQTPYFETVRSLYAEVNKLIQTR